MAKEIELPSAKVTLLSGSLAERADYLIVRVHNSILRFKISARDGYWLFTAELKQRAEDKRRA